MEEYLNGSDFQYCEMDTDSAHVMIAGPSEESLIIPELRVEFEKEKAIGSPELTLQSTNLMIKALPAFFE